MEKFHPGITTWYPAAIGSVRLWNRCPGGWGCIITPLCLARKHQCIFTPERLPRFDQWLGLPSYTQFIWAIMSKCNFMLRNSFPALPTLLWWCSLSKVDDLFILGGGAVSGFNCQCWRRILCAWVNTVLGGITHDTWFIYILYSTHVHREFISHFTASQK